MAPLGAASAEPVEPDFAGWKQVQTAHFTFIYEARDALAVDELLSFAEEVYDDVTGLLGSHPSHIPVVVAGRQDLANGYTTPAPPHITLYLVPPSEPLIGLESSQYLRLLLTHELTHFVNFDYDKGMFAFLSGIFGPAVRDVNAAFLPTWFLEGIATYTETAFTDGGRGRSPFFEMEYRALVYSSSFFPLSKAAYTSFFRRWTGTGSGATCSSATFSITGESKSISGSTANIQSFRFLAPGRQLNARRDGRRGRSTKTWWES